MNLKPQDIVVLLKLIAIGNRKWSYNELSVELFMSTSAIHDAIKRSLQAQLAIKIEEKIVPHLRNLEEFIVHGLRYIFIVEKGALSRGMPTSYAAMPLSEVILADHEPVPVWPDSEGEVRGFAFSPLYHSVPKAVKKDKKLYELLALVDAIRDGRAREREIATKEIIVRLRNYE